MASTKGRPLTAEQKQSIVLVKSYFDRNKTSLVGWNDSSAQMTADALGVGLATVDRVLSRYKKDPESISSPGKSRGKPDYAVSNSYEDAIRNYIRSANMQGEYVTLDTIKKSLLESAPEKKLSNMTLGRTLDRWGFEFGKGKRTQHLKEKDHVIAARRKYLRKMRENRKGKTNAIIRPEVYLDESYVNKNHSNDFTWYSREDGPWVQKPTGKGERLIIINAITEDGWVPNAKVVFKSTRKTGDYHGQMNAELFEKWFVKELIPNIPDNSNIIMDNASYHNVLSKGSPPTVTCAKIKIQSWFDANKIPYGDDCLKAELVEILRRLLLEPIYSLDELAAESGHKIIRTPPYHPELQPIEICWGVLKNYVARNCDFTMENLFTQLDVAFKEVTAETCRKIIKRVREIEDNFWKEDLKQEEMYLA
jgi:transposase